MTKIKQIEIAVNDDTPLDKINFLVDKITELLISMDITAVTLYHEIEEECDE